MRAASPALTAAQINAVFGARYSPQRLIHILSSQFDTLYARDAGVWEKYTIGRHTTMVLRQFEKYFANYELPRDVNKNHFRLFLALHDIGKPIAIAQEGKKHQHNYTWKIMHRFYTQIEIEPSFIDISKALLYDDPIGAYLRDRRSKQETEKLIRMRAHATVLECSDYFHMLQIYYKVDAGSYTVNAGGKPSLDALFEFDEATPELRFAADIQEKIDLLRI